MNLQAPSLADLPLSKMTAQTVGIILLIGMVLYFVLKVVESQHDTIKRLIDKIKNGGKE
jgi:hypothetical protein